MKRSYTVLFFLLTFFFSQGQTLIVSVTTVTANIGDTVFIPVKLTGASNSGIPISSANIQITYDTAVLTYHSLTNFYAATPQNQWFFSGYNGLVSANWLEPSIDTLAIPDSTTLYEIKFVKKAGSAPLTFVVYEFTDVIYNLIPTTPVHGAVNAPVIYHQAIFRVNMQNQVVSPDGVHLAGSFNNWSCSETLMSPETGSIYSATVILPENQSYTYRFVNGDTLTAMEAVPAECGVLNSSGEYERIMALSSNDTTLNPLCFGMCADCPLNVSVTFRVNMQNQVVSSNGVHLAGSFNNWSCSETLMSQETGSIYSATVNLPENQSYAYRFVNGDTLTAMETVPVECGVLNSSGEYERIMTLASNDTTMNQVCFGMCADCPLNVSVTFRVNMQNQVVSPNGVHLAGSFNNWSYSQTSMNQVGGFIYETSVILEEGSSLEFLFVNGNSIAGAEIVPDVCAVNGKRYMTVPNHDSVLIAYCFDSCSACTNVVQYTNVTFKVDMRLVDTISPNGVFIAGSFQGWLPGMTAMITSGDSIYSFSDSLRAGQTVQYKFVNGNTGDEYEIVPLPCAVNGNREITIPVNDTILPLVCFSSCDSCLITGSPDHGSLIKSRLMQNSPNPCNDYTTISFRLHDSGKVNINLFDLTGRKTAVLSEGHYNAGTYKVQVETKQIKSGIYYYQLNFEGTSVFSESKKMVVVH